MASKLNFHRIVNQIFWGRRIWNQVFGIWMFVMLAIFTWIAYSQLMLNSWFIVNKRVLWMWQSFGYYNVVLNGYYFISLSLSLFCLDSTKWILVTIGTVQVMEGRVTMDMAMLCHKTRIEVCMPMLLWWMEHLPTVMWTISSQLIKLNCVVHGSVLKTLTHWVWGRMGEFNHDPEILVCNLFEFCSCSFFFFWDLWNFE